MVLGLVGVALLSALPDWRTACSNCLFLTILKLNILSSSSYSQLILHSKATEGPYPVSSWTARRLHGCIEVSGLKPSGWLELGLENVHFKFVAIILSHEFCFRGGVSGPQRGDRVSLAVSLKWFPHRVCAACYKIIGVSPLLPKIKNKSICRSEPQWPFG